MFGSLALLCLVIGALLLIIGWRRGAVRLLLAGVALAMVSPLLERGLGNLAGQTNRYGGLLIGVAVIMLALVAWVRYVNRRRALKQWFGAKPTSLKRRVDRQW